MYTFSLDLAMLFNAAISSWLGIFVWLRNRKRQVNITFLLLNLAVVGWNIGLFLSFSTGSVFANRFGNASSILLTAFWLHFALAFINKVAQRKKVLILAYILTSIMGFITLFTNWCIRTVEPKIWFNYYPDSPPFYLVYLLLYILVITYGLYELFKTYRASVGIKHNQLRYIMLGTIIGFTLAPTSMFLLFDIPVYPFGLYLAWLYIPILSYAIVRYRLLDIEVVLSRTVLGILLAGLILLLHTGVASFIQPYIGYGFSTLVSVAVIVILLFFTPIRRTLQNAIDSFVYRGRFDYRKVLRESTKALVTILNLNDLLNYLTRVISENIGTDRVSLLLAQEERGSYRIFAHHGLDRDLVRRFNLISKNGIIGWLRDNKEVFVREEMELSLPRDAFEEVYKDLGKIGAEVIIPISYKGQIKGIVNLGPKSSGRAYSQQDIDVLQSLADQAAIAIENARLYTEAITDGLTKLYHHEYFIQRLEEELSRSKRYKYSLSLFMLDLDSFKSFNDKYGHLAGDEILKGVARLIKENVRRSDISARYGGEEFSIILPETSLEGAKVAGEKLRGKIEGALQIAEQIRKGVEQKLAYLGKGLGITVSIGVACFSGRDESMTVEKLISQADSALYKAKAGGRNKIKVF